MTKLLLLYSNHHCNSEVTDQELVISNSYAEKISNNDVAVENDTSCDGMDITEAISAVLSGNDNAQFSTDASKPSQFSNTSSNTEDVVTMNGKQSCASIIRDSTNSASSRIKKTDEVDSHSNDLCYVIENLHIDVTPDNLPSSGTAVGNSGDTLKMPADPKIKVTPRSSHLVTINIPFDDSGEPTIAEDQDSTLVIENPLLTATAVHNTQSASDVKTTETSETNEQSYSYVQIIQDSTKFATKEIVKANSLSNETENLHIDAMATDSPSPAVTPQSSYLVAIDIPYDDSSMPTLAEDTVDTTVSNSNVSTSIKMQRNPAYATITRTTSGVHLYEEIHCSTAPITSASGTNANAPIEMQRNPTYTTITHTTSGVHLYEEIHCSTAPITSASGTSANAPIKMQRNPAYVAISHAESQKHPTTK